jgi:hypothetical protein
MHNDRCHCAECTKLDRMRLQGIPGTYQMRLDAVPPAEPGLRYVMENERAMADAKSCDTLPLFMGSLQPTLF